MDRYQKIYKKVADNNSLSKYVVEDIFKSQCSLVEKTMKENMSTKEDKPIRLPGIGVFYVKAGVRDYWNKIEKQQDEQQDK